MSISNLTQLQVSWKMNVCLRGCHTERMKTQLLKPEIRDRIKYLSSDQFGVDEKKRPAAEDVTQASFRKLNIDWTVEPKCTAKKT